MVDQYAARHRGSPSDNEARRRSHRRIACRFGRAILLAAGKGTRLQPLTADLPKCLVEVDGKPLLMRALEALSSQGVEEAVIVDGLRRRHDPRAGGHLVCRAWHDSLRRSPRLTRPPTTSGPSGTRGNTSIKTSCLLEADVAFDPGSRLPRCWRYAGQQCRGGAVPSSAFSGTIVHRERRRAGHQLHARRGAGPRAATLAIPPSRPSTSTCSAQATCSARSSRARVCAALWRPVTSTGTTKQCSRTAVAERRTPRDLTAVDVSAHRWYEIDDHRDLDAADVSLPRPRHPVRPHPAAARVVLALWVHRSLVPVQHVLPAARDDGAVFHDDLHEVVTNYPGGPAGAGAPGR